MIPYRFLCALAALIILSLLFLLRMSAKQTMQGGLNGQPVPHNAVVMVLSGPCPTNYAEVSSLNGAMPEGTLNANGDAGGTGGSNTFTPQGTNGTSSYTPAGTNSAPTFTGSVQNMTAANNVSLLAAGTALTGPTSFTPAGTVSAPAFSGTPATISAETFTGTQADQRPAFVKVIFCQAN